MPAMNGGKPFRNKKTETRSKENQEKQLYHWFYAGVDGIVTWQDRGHPQGGIINNLTEAKKEIKTAKFRNTSEVWRLHQITLQLHYRSS